MLIRPLSAVSLLAAAALAQTAAADLAATERLEGRVLDLRGDPVPAADVWVATLQDPDTVLARGKCDGEGFFVLRVAVREEWEVFASADGCVVARDDVRPGGAPTTLALHDAAVVRGMLRDRKGQPVADAGVRAALDRARGSDYGCDSITDADGRFTLPKVPLGMVVVSGVVPGEGLAGARLYLRADAEVTLVPGNDPTTSLALIIAGLPAATAPQVRITLHSYETDWLRILPMPWQRPALDGGGRGRLDHIPDWQYDVHLSAPGWVFDPDEIRLAEGRGPHETLVTAAPTGGTPRAWPGVLRDGGGRPVGGVRLAVHAVESVRTHMEAVTAGDGAFSFTSGLATGIEAVVETCDAAWVLDQAKPDRRFATVESLRRAAVHECRVDPSRPLSLRAVPCCCVEGRVQLTDGGPASLVTVGLEHESANRTPRWMAFASTNAARDGTFRIVGVHHLSDPVRVRIEGRAGAFASAPFALAEPGARVDLRALRLARPATIEGTVRDIAGQPVPGMRVRLRDWDFEHDTEKTALVEVITNRRGRYRFVGVPPGGAWLQLTIAEDFPKDRAVEPFEVTSGETCTFDLTAKE